MPQSDGLTLVSLKLRILVRIEHHALKALKVAVVAHDAAQPAFARHLTLLLLNPLSVDFRVDNLHDGAVALIPSRVESEPLDGHGEEGRPVASTEDEAARGE